MSHVNWGLWFEAEEGIARVCTWHSVVRDGKVPQSQRKTNRTWRFASLG